MTFRLVHELAADGIPAAVACRVLKVSESGYHAWRSRPVSARALADRELIEVIRQIHETARGTYGVRRVHAELRLGRHLVIGHGRVERLMRLAGLQGVHHRKWRRGGGGRLPAVFEDRVQRKFVADGPDKLWVTDITQHMTGEGWVYCAAVLDVYSRRCIGWSIADHLRTELVLDALDMARWRRQPSGTIVHSDRGTQAVFNRSSQRLLVRSIVVALRRPRQGCASPGSLSGGC
nr:IS3 family transposase [Microbacterium bovistercoris]